MNALLLLNFLTFFYPHQHGVGVPGGAENVVQGLRLAKALNKENVVVGIDFSNAFNSVDRQAIAFEVEKHFPQVKTWFEMCYGRPTHLIVKNQNPIASVCAVFNKETPLAHSCLQ